MAGPEGGLPMQVVNWEGIGVPRPLLSFSSRGARAGGGFTIWDVGWDGLLVTVEKTLRVGLQGKNG